MLKTLSAAICALAIGVHPSPAQAARGTVLLPMLSFFVPGFGQWWYGPYSDAALYSGAALGGVALVYSANSPSLNSSSVGTQLTERDDRVRTLILGSKIEETAGELSMYQSFRDAVVTQQAKGHYLFLPNKKNAETSGDLLMAPLHFSFLKRPTAFVPLGALAIMLALGFQHDQHQGLTIADDFFSVGTSYTAGVGEEALFRGYLMPQFMYLFDNGFWSDTTSAVLFGAAHIASDNPVPIAQFLMGWYLGWVSQQNSWTLSENIFIHTWWDAMALLYDTSVKTTNATVMVPLVSATF